MKMYHEIHRGLVPTDTLFIHGNLANTIWWEPALELWKEKAKGKGYTGSLIFADWRGCGQSPGPESEADLEMPVLAQDHIDLLRSLGVARANVVGHSTGGLIALKAMLKEPGLFHRAVLLDPVTPEGLKIDQTVLDRFEMARNNREFLTMAIAGTIYGPRRPAPELFARIMDSAVKVHKTNWQGVLKVLGRVSCWEDCARIPHPTLVLHGEFDFVLELPNSERLARELPNGRFQKLDGQGHSCSVENPERFVGITDAFLFG